MALFVEDGDLCADCAGYYCHADIFQMFLPV